MHSEPIYVDFFSTASGGEFEEKNCKSCPKMMALGLQFKLHATLFLRSHPLQMHCCTIFQLHFLPNEERPLQMFLFLIYSSYSRQSLNKFCYRDWTNFKLIYWRKVELLRLFFIFLKNSWNSWFIFILTIWKVYLSI